MNEDTIYEAPRKCSVSKMRVHDYLYDSSYIVSGARDYARTAFKAAMESAQVSVHPVYNTMFSELRKFPRLEVVYYPNCRLPDHVDRSYDAYKQRIHEGRSGPIPDPNGKFHFRFCAVPKKVPLSLKRTTPDFRPATPGAQSHVLTHPRHRATQSVYRESSAQTVPWQAEAQPAEGCKATPEVLFLDKMEWGAGHPYRQGDLPADFHTTEIINKMRHARKWMDLVDKGQLPGWMKKRDDIIKDVETKDWIFREAEIDELQDIRLVLLHRLQLDNRRERTGRVSKKLAKLWTEKKLDMERKIEDIRRKRDRELRKLSAQHNMGGADGQVQAMRASRGGGSPLRKPSTQHRCSTRRYPETGTRRTENMRRLHTTLRCYLFYIVLEDHIKASEPPAWLNSCGQDLKHSCSGHHLPRNTTQLCERETKWSEQFLKNLHDDLKKARLGATIMAAGPLRVLKPRRTSDGQRPATPEVEAVDDEEEANHQHALLLQRIIRGRAVQNLMFDGRTRAAELTEELKTTHGLQKEDKARIAKEETRAREHIAMRTEEDAVSALVDELCGGAVAAALDFLEKELRRLKEERKHHAFILIALREKTMREAAEAGRRQKEEHRRREHDEMFKRVLGVTQETVDAYLKEVIQEGVELASEVDAVRTAQSQADKIEEAMRASGSMSTAEQNELVAELVQQFLLPEAHKAASRHHIAAVQETKMAVARRTIFNLIDESGKGDTETCIRCGSLLDETCRCRHCPVDIQPVETAFRDDPRWKHTRSRPKPPARSFSERIPLEHELRYKINDILHEAVDISRKRASDLQILKMDLKQDIYERYQVLIDARQAVDDVINRAIGALPPAVMRPEYHYFMTRRVSDALHRPETRPPTCPTELPSVIRSKAEKIVGDTCMCVDQDATRADVPAVEDETKLLPSQLRALEDLKRCKCDLELESQDGRHPSSSNADAATDGYITSDTERSVPENERV